MEIRALESPDDLKAALAPLEQVFGFELSKEDLEREKRFQPPDRFLVASTDGRIVGSAAALPFRLTVPGGTVAAAGITSVGVMPTHRRRGIMSALIDRQLAECRGRGEPVAVLWASEGSIYGRFGFGMATLSCDVDVDRAHLRLPERSPAVEARVVTLDEAKSAIPPIYERARTVGMLVRPDAWWEAKALPAPEYGGAPGAPPLRWVVLSLDGRDEAYAGYRLSTCWEDGVPAGTLRVLEAIGATPAALVEMWRWLAKIDLVARVEARRLAIDHPLLLLVPELARLRVRVGDGLWLRVVDLRSALAARSLRGEGSVALELADERCPWNAGRWLVDASGARRTRRSPELRLGASELGAVYLGGTTFAQLAAAGRVEVLRRGAVERADALFRTDRMPWCPEVF